MSKYYVLTPTGYRITLNPPKHNRWIYDKKTDSYYEQCGEYIKKIRQERENNDN